MGNTPQILVGEEILVVFGISCCNCSGDNSDLCNNFVDIIDAVIHIGN